MTAQLSKNFTMAELTASATAKSKGINNEPSFRDYTRIHDALQQLAYRVLQPVRDRFGPVKVTSGYRSPQLNAEVGGNPNSQHSKGEAGDFDVPGVDNLVVAKWISKNLNFDQLILEDYVGGNSGWIHVSYKRSGNRKQVLTKPVGTSDFTPGLPGSQAEATAQAVTENKGKIFAVVGGITAGIWYLFRKKK